MKIGLWYKECLFTGVSMSKWGKMIHTNARTAKTQYEAIILERTGYFANEKWYKTRAKRSMIGKLIQDPLNGLYVWVADAYIKYYIVHRKEIEGKCIRCAGASETTIDAPYCPKCFEEAEDGSPVRECNPKPKPEIHIESVHMGKALGYFLEDPYEEGKWQWVKEESSVGIMPMPVRVAFEEAGRCIKCDTPTSTITVKNPYCGGCEKEVLASEKVWIKGLAEKKKLKKEQQMMEDMKKQPWRIEEQKPVVVENWETSKRKQKEEEIKKQKAKEKREKEKAKKLDYEIVKQPGTSKIKKVAKQIIEYEKKKGTLESILK